MSRLMTIASLLMAFSVWSCTESAGNAGLGESCADDSSCESGVCIQHGAAQYCSLSCEGACPTAADGTEFECQQSFCIEIEHTRSVGDDAGVGGADGDNNLGGTGGDDNIGGTAGDDGTAGSGGTAGDDGTAGAGGTAGSGGAAGAGADDGTAGSGGEAGAAGGPAPGDLSCLGMLDCFSTCPDGDQNCYQICFDESSAQAQGEYMAIIECFDATNCEANDTCDQACGGEIAICYGEDPGPGPVPGDLNCAGMFDCFGTCADGDQACYQVCFDGSTAAAQAQYADIAQCVQDTGCEQNDTCDQACAQPIGVCFGEDPGPAPVDMSCGEMFTCFDGCGDGDQACYQRCYEGSTVQAQAEYDDIAVCVDRTGCDAPGGDCNVSCADEAAICFDAPAPGEGLGCDGLLTCVNGCADETCFNDCGRAADAQAIELYNAFAECAQASGCDTMEACSAACPGDLAACRADG